jgi:inosine-uridine nucleoside N-ribohydrolase
MLRMREMRVLLALAALAAVVGLRGAGGQAAAAAGKTPAAPQLVILDTDIGDDIDDAFALALVLRSPELRLLGVTTTYGDTELRARLVDRYLGAVGRSGVPVRSGVRTKSGTMSQAAYALREPARQHGDGVGFLLREIRAHPGEITLIAIGPLVNVQAAIERDPATFRKLKRVVMMGGSVYRGYDHGGNGTRQPPSAEWNILCDPTGAKELLASGVPVFMMPLDSTQIHLEQAAQAAIFSHGSALTDQLTLLYHEWSGAGAWRTPTLFDPMAVTYAIRPELCPATPMRLEVDEKGFTRPVEGEPNVNVCLHGDEKGFLGLLLGRITGEAAH